MDRNRLLTAVVLLVLGSGLASTVQTDGGRIDVKDLRFVGAAGNMMSGLLYRPLSATPDHPAPAVLAIHGYINSRETQSGFAIELARRGFVVLALDQTGHGFSDPPALAYGFGGPDGLNYLRQLPFVDPDRIGLEGHSMGGWAVQMAAAALPDGYASMVLEGSSTGTFGAPDGTPDRPRNLKLVFSRFDEFSELMWGAKIPADIVNTDKLKTLFGTEEAVVAGKIYGNIALGTARELAMPAVTHPGDHLSREAIGEAVVWFERTLGQNTAIDSTMQTWYWKELGTLIALVGLSVLVFPLIDGVLTLSVFQGLGVPPSAAVPATRLIRWIGVFSAAIIPVLTFFPLQTIANVLLPANPLLPQQITNGVLLWAWGTGAISLLIFILCHRKSGVTMAQLGCPWQPSLMLKAFGLALVTCSTLYLVVLAADFLLNIDFRFWVVALKRMTPDQLLMFLVYLPLFSVFFFVLSLTLHAHDGRGAMLAGNMWKNGFVLSTGFVVLLIVQYAPLLAGGTLLFASQPLLSIVAFQFVPILFMVGLVSTFCYARTNTIFTGVLINSLFVTWYMVAGTATQALPFWSLH